MALKHDNCGGLVTCTEGPEPPDPDRHGNYWLRHKCQSCGETWPICDAPHQGLCPPSDVTIVDDRGVDPRAVCEP